MGMSLTSNAPSVDSQIKAAVDSVNAVSVDIRTGGGYVGQVLPIYWHTVATLANGEEVLVSGYDLMGTLHALKWEVDRKLDADK